MSGHHRQQLDTFICHSKGLVPSIVFTACRPYNQISKETKRVLFACYLSSLLFLATQIEKTNVGLMPLPVGR